MAQGTESWLIEDLVVSLSDSGCCGNDRLLPGIRVSGSVHKKQCRIAKSSMGIYSNIMWVNHINRI